ncbi:NAD(P)-dependent oxidoreductase [Candidatus Micrarchaeota archaeon]|nr:NAD(P)-dependent oxidoreductase [Candidatus Micrarchaeota archaeon]MBU1930158.1 NAD(P)-dependent oxidoreductase [Candidatus Micrarchaeota archaeon]
MKILVTGSTGLIGKEVVKQLQAKNMEIVEYSNSQGQDILDLKQLKKAAKGCHGIIHLAAIIDENASKNKIWKTNVEGTKNVLDAATQEKVGRLVFLSSVGVYGNQTGTKTEETPSNPTSAYEKSKVEGEKLVQEYQELISYTVIRSALVIGPNQYWKQIFKTVKKNTPLVGTGTNPWQTIYYKDLANAIVFLLFLDAAENETFLVAGEEKPSLKELVSIMRGQAGLSAKVPTVSVWMGKLMGFFLGILWKLQGKPNIFAGNNIDRLLRERAYDLTKMHAYGWKAKYSFQEALKETLFELEQEGKNGKKKALDKENAY